MSNQGVGNVYQQVIKDVIESSRVDFEEGGVDESVLEELSKGWQKKLSALGIAQFPWDPKPEPPVQVQQQQQQQQPMQQQMHQNYAPHDMSSPQTISVPQMQMPQMQGAQGGPRIKAEPGLESNGMNGQPPNYPQSASRPPAGASAAEIAAFNLQTQYGGRASESINALQSGINQQNRMQGQQRMQAPLPNMQQTQPPLPQQPQQQRPVSQQARTLSQVEYNQQMARQAAQQRQTLQGQTPQADIKTSQTDGAGDDSYGVLSSIDANGKLIDLGRVEIDEIIRRQIEARGLAMEGGGLMLPLKQHVTSQSNVKQKRPTGGDAVNDSDDDIKDEDDEDAINSDLDDPDDGLNDEDEEDADGVNVMLCMYDKVQRVKNKWKCVMKDGVITINGKEYVFHKASGEYEW